MMSLSDISNEIFDQAAELKDAAERDDVEDMGIALDNIFELAEKLLPMVEG
jgi:hypothetical protein